MRSMEAFLAVLAVGGLLCGTAWILARRRIRQSGLWRAPFCLLLAVFVTPSVVKIGGSWVLIPAVFIAPVAISDADDVRAGLLFGVLPIVLVAGMVFVVWTIIVRRHRHAD